MVYLSPNILIRLGDATFLRRQADQLLPYRQQHLPHPPLWESAGSTRSPSDHPPKCPPIQISFCQNAQPSKHDGAEHDNSSLTQAD